MLPLEKFFIMTEKLENVNVMSVFVILPPITRSWHSFFYDLYKNIKNLFKKVFFSWVTTWHVAPLYKFSLGSRCSKTDQVSTREQFDLRKFSDSSIVVEKRFCYFIYNWWKALKLILQTFSRSPFLPSYPANVVFKSAFNVLIY